MMTTTRQRSRSLLVIVQNSNRSPGKMGLTTEWPQLEADVSPGRLLVHLLNNGISLICTKGSHLEIRTRSVQLHAWLNSYSLSSSDRIRFPSVLSSICLSLSSAFLKRQNINKYIFICQLRLLPRPPPPPIWRTTNVTTSYNNLTYDLV